MPSTRRCQRGGRSLSAWATAVALGIGSVGGCSEPEPCDCWRLLSVIQQPQPGQVDVPRNTRIWLSASFGEASLIHESGVRVPVLRGLVEGGEAEAVGVLTPIEPLAPLSRYAVMFDTGPDGGTYWTFTTGEAEDTEPPPPPEETGRRVDCELSGPGQARRCTEGACAATLTIRPREAGMTFLDVDQKSQLDFDRMELRTSGVLVSSHVYVGNSECWGNWPEAEAGRRIPVRLATVDWSGNVSPFYETEVVLDSVNAIPTGAVKDRVGCAAAAPWPVGAMMLLLALRRRTGWPRTPT